MFRVKPKVKNIVKRQRELNLSNAAVGRIAGLPPNAVGRLISGESQRTHYLRAQAIANALECDFNELFEERK